MENVINLWQIISPWVIPVTMCTAMMLWGMFLMKLHYKPKVEKLNKKADEWRQQALELNMENKELRTENKQLIEIGVELKLENTELKLENTELKLENTELKLENKRLAFKYNKLYLDILKHDIRQIEKSIKNIRCTKDSVQPTEFKVKPIEFQPKDISQLAVGETFELDGKLLKVVESISGCVDCEFIYNRPCKYILKCTSDNRRDNKSVIFKPVTSIKSRNKKGQFTAKQSK